MTRPNWGEVITTAGFVLSMSASIAYFLQRDWRHGLYWFFAAGLTALVTWGFK